MRINQINATQTLSYISILKISLLWLPLVLWYVCGFIFTHDPRFFTQVDNIYYAAGQAWLHQQPLYHCHGNGCFVYLPTSAVFFIPLGVLPLKMAALIFRLLSLIIFTQGMYCFCRDITAYDLKRTFFIVLAVTVLLSQAALFVGQLHMIMAGLILLSASSIAREKWWRAAIFLSVAVALKPTAIVFCALIATLYPRTALKQIILVTVLLSSVFLTQSSHYVITQYQGFAQEFINKMHFDMTHMTHWATLFSAIAFFTKQVINGQWAFTIRLFVAFVVCFIAMRAVRTLNKTNAVYFIFTISMCYLMLFNSRTENSDYVMMMPFIGYTFVILFEKKQWLILSTFFIALACLLANWNLSKLISPGNNLWLNPTVITLYTIYFIFFLRKKLC